jgi:hypothetical protein
MLRERVAAGRRLAEAIAAALPPTRESATAAASMPPGHRSRRVKSEYSSLSKGRAGSAGGSAERGPGAALDMKLLISPWLLAKFLPLICVLLRLLLR